VTIDRAARASAYESVRPEVFAHIPPGVDRVLDLGCASGALGAALKARGAREVVGVEIDPDYAQDARVHLDRVVCADLTELAARDDLDADLGRFDCLIAADVLEHLPDPWLVLRRFAALLEPGCRAVVSLPNVRFWETFWQVGIRGTWPRRAVGIFDAGHLRWFTHDDARALVEEADLAVEYMAPSLRLVPRGSRLDRLAGPLSRVPGLLPFVTFQHIIAARRNGPILPAP
jgi:2-polyprenyl-3-methyl-5-hydroxy-6-metoxy-1,4-benzoquinol methylase